MQGKLEVSFFPLAIIIAKCIVLNRHWLQFWLIFWPRAWRDIGIVCHIKLAFDEWLVKKAQGVETRPRVKRNVEQRSGTSLNDVTSLRINVWSIKAFSGYHLHPQTTVFYCSSILIGFPRALKVSKRN